MQWNLDDGMTSPPLPFRVTASTSLRRHAVVKAFIALILSSLPEGTEVEFSRVDSLYLVLFPFSVLSLDTLHTLYPHEDYT